MVTPSYYPLVGGTESLIENITMELNKMGIGTDVMTFNIDEKWNPWSVTRTRRENIEKINGVKVIKIQALTLLPLRPLFRINFIPGRFTHQLTNYDIIHFHNEIDLSFPIFSLKVNKPKIFHCHLLNISYNSFKSNPIQKYLLKKVASFYIVPSTYMKKLLINLGVSETKTTVIPNGIDVRKFHPSKEMKKENLILFVGRLHPTKGLHVLLEALKYLHTCVKLVVIGRPSSRPSYFKKVLCLIERENRRGIHKIIYLGPLKPEKIIYWYQKASIFVCPSLSESFGIANLEAMACSTAVVSTYVGGIPEVVKNYENGILVQPNNAIELAKAIQYLLDNESVRINFGKAGRKRAIKFFSSDVIAKKIYEIYKKLVT